MHLEINIYQAAANIWYLNLTHILFHFYITLKNNIAKSIYCQNLNMYSMIKITINEIQNNKLKIP